MNAIVSVVMPSFNSARHISDALHSVINQSLREFEVIVVDGGSVDSTRDIVTMLANSDSRIRLITNDDDHGPAHARCVGIRAAKGDYVAFLDADDLWLPSKLESQVLFMRAKGASFSYTRFRHVSENGVIVGCLVPMRHSYGFKDALTHRGIGTLTVMIARELLTEDVISIWLRAGCEECVWWLMILRKGITAQLLNEDLARYRDTDGSLSKDQLYTVRSVWRMYRRELGLSMVRTALSYSSYLFDAGLRKLRLRLCSAINRCLAYKRI